jgi:predicted acyltransferase
MFWIVGGEELVHALYKAWPTGPLHVLDRQMSHKAWEGFAFYDLIFPLFVFMGYLALWTAGQQNLSKGLSQFGKTMAVLLFVSAAARSIS